MKTKIIVIISALFMLSLPSLVFALEESLAVNSKEIITRLTRVEEGQIRLEEGQKELNTRLTKVEEGQKELNTRLTRVEEGQNGLRGGQIKIEEGQKALVQRIDDLKDLTYVLLGGILALVGFVLWDRRTTISPVVRKAQELEERDKLTMTILKEYAQKEPQMAEILRSKGIL